MRSSFYQQRVFRQLQAASAATKPKFEYMLEYKGVKVILTDHARQQASKRHGMPIESMKTFFQHAIDGYLNSDFKIVEYNQEVFIYSRAFQRGLVVAFRRDFKNEDSKNLCMVAVTVYPYGVAHPAHKDTEVIYV